MEGQQPNPLYQILESSSNFWPPLTSIDGFLSPQNCNNISPYQNLDTTINPPSPPLIHGQNGVVDMPQHQTEFIQNLNSNSVIEQPVSKKRGRPKQKMKEKETWYKGPWTKSEDRKLRRLVLHYGCVSWTKIARFMAGRIGKQCRERWHNNLRPPISKNIVWSDEEEMMIIEGHKRFGNRWSRIARFLPGRSENDVKNHFNKTKRRQFSTKNIQRPKRLRRLYKSTVLENYIRKKFLNTGSTSSAANAPPIATAITHTPPPITENNALFQIFSTTSPITAAAGAAAFFTTPPINENYNALTATFSTTAATATAFTPPPLTTITENNAAFSTAAATFTTNTENSGLYAIFSTTTPITAATSIQPPILTLIENNALIAPFSTTPAATFFTPPPITENYNALTATFSTFTPPPITESNATFFSAAATTFAPPPFTTNTEDNALFAIFTTATATATTFIQPPIPIVSENSALISPFSTIITENYNALTATVSTTAAATFAPPPITENNAAFSTFDPPPFTTNTENNALIATDLPLSVDDYDSDGIPFFTFKTAIDEISDLTQPSFAIESAIDENADFMQNMYYGDTGNAEGLIGIHPSPIVGEADYAASASYFAAETVDEEMDFMRSLFGYYGEIWR